jgi:putative ABC transport system substrate-binding protein
MEVSSADKYETAFREAVEARNTALWVTLNPLANSNQKKIADLAIHNRLPSICARSDYSENGCMMAYGRLPAEAWKASTIYWLLRPLGRLVPTK